MTGFLSVATDEEKAAVLSIDPVNPAHLDTRGMTGPLWAKLSAWLCGLVRPPNPEPITTMSNTPLLLTLRELRHYDNQDNGVYTAIDGIVYDISCMACP